MLNLLRRRPVFAQYALTYRCNSRCRSCEYWRKGNGEELSLDGMGRLAGQLRAFGIRILTLTGGEPFMREDALEAIRLFQGRGFRVTLNTNGILLDERLIAGLSGLERLHVVVSLDSLDQKRYRSLRGVDALTRVLDAMRLINKETPHEVRVFTAVSGENCDEVLRILEFCRRQGYLFSAYPIMGARTGRWFSSAEMVRSDDGRERIASLFDRLAALAPRERALFGFSGVYSGAARFLRGEVLPQCGAGRHLIQVAPDGRIAACPETAPFCDARSEDLAAAYRDGGWRVEVERCSSRTPCYIGCTRTLPAIRSAPLRFAAERLTKAL